MSGLRESTYSLLLAGVAATALGVGASVTPVYAQGPDSGGSNQHMQAGADSSTAARVKAALNSDPNFRAKNVDVSMKNGQVVLTGSVQDNRELLDATRIATKAAGDRKVVNNLTITQNYPNAP